MDTNIVIVLVASVIAIIAAVLITAKVTTNRLKKNAEGTIGNAEEKAREIIDEALKTAENKKRESLLEVKEESIRTKNELDKEIKERRAEAQRYERRVQQKEENIDKKADAIEKREASLASREESLNRMKEEVSRLNEQRVQELNHMMDIAARSLKIKRGVITKLLNEGLYPYTKRYLGTFENHFSTIGLIGMNEVGLNANWLRADMSDPRTQEFTKEVLNHMRERLSDYQEQYGDLYNLEATPAESTTYRLAKHDRKRWPGIKTAGKPGDTPYYTNSSHLPVDYTVDIFDALDIQDELQTLYTSGTVFHAFLGEKLPDWKAAASLVRTIASNYKLPYYTLSPTYSICKEHGYLAGEVKVCPHCGAKTEVYSRITGYYRPVQNWNDGKLQEYANRTEYDIAHSSLKRPTRSVVTLSNFAEEVDVKVEQPQNIKYLFTTKTCPNCKLVKEYLKNVPYVTIDAEENMELARRYGVMQAPTLVVVNGDSHKKYVNASNIKKYVDQLTLVGVE